MVMNEGEIVEMADSPTRSIAHPRHPYTQKLLSSIPGRAQ